MIISELAFPLRSRHRMLSTASQKSSHQKLMCSNSADERLYFEERDCGIKEIRLGSVEISSIPRS